MIGLSTDRFTIIVLGQLHLRLKLLLLVASVLVSIALFVLLAHQLPVGDGRLAFDWKMLWPAFKDGQLRWGEYMYSPPWSIIFVMPLGYVSLTTSWGIMMFITTLSLILSVPTQRVLWRQVIGICLLALSYPALREFMDANFEAFTILGVLLLLHGYHSQAPILAALGMLLAMIKPQLTYLLLLVAALYIVENMPRTYQFKIGIVLLLIMAPAAVWQGRPWLESFNENAFDWGISLAVVLKSAHVPLIVIRLTQVLVVLASLTLAWKGNRQLTRVKVGMLIAGAALAAPYSQGHSLLVVLAIAIIPALLTTPVYALLGFLLPNLAFLKMVEVMPAGLIPSATFSLVVMWLILLWLTYVEEVRVMVPAASIK